jgi:hypothetical protein
LISAGGTIAYLVGWLEAVTVERIPCSLTVIVTVIYFIFNQIQQIQAQIQPLDIESITVFNNLAFYDVPKQNSLEQVEVIIGGGSNMTGTDCV